MSSSTLHIKARLSRRSTVPTRWTLPASADLSQSEPEAGEKQDQPAQQDQAGQDQGQQVERGQVERVGCRQEAEVPAEEQGVHGGQGQSRVAQS